jgi:hypothetical protein
LADLKDPADRTSIEKTSHEILTRATNLIQRIAPRIWDRHEQASS